MRIYTGLTLTILSLSACHERRQLAEMHDNTIEMNKTTKGMADTTTEMNRTTKSVDTNSKELKNTTKEMNRTTKAVAQYVRETNDKMDQMYQEIKVSNTQIGQVNQQTTAANQKMESMDYKMNDLHEMKLQVQNMSEQLSDMKKELGGTNSKLDSANAKMDAMKSSTSLIAEVTGELGDSARPAISLASRREAIAQLLIDDKDRDLKLKLTRRLSEAAKYFSAFDFQWWTNVGKDLGLEKRNELATLAVREFMRDVQQFLDEPDQIERPEVDSEKITDMGFNALAATMSTVNPKQLEVIKSYQQKQTATEDKVPSKTAATQPEVLKPMSIYELLKTSLLASKEISENKKQLSDFPAYVEEVLKFEAVAVLLMQARQNVLASMVIGKLIPGFYDRAKGKFLNWDMDFSKLKTAQLKELAGFSKGASTTRKSLMDLGLDTQDESSLLDIFNNAQFKPETVNGRSAADQALIQEVVANMLAYRNNKD